MHTNKLGLMNIETHANFSDHYVAAVVKAPSRALVRVPVEDIQVLMCVDLDAEVQKYLTTGSVRSELLSLLAKAIKASGWKHESKPQSLARHLFFFR